MPIKYDAEPARDGRRAVDVLAPPVDGRALTPTLQYELHTTQNTVTLVLTAYLLSASIATPILGRLADRFGKEKMLIVSLTALGLGALVAAPSRRRSPP